MQSNDKIMRRIDKLLQKEVFIDLTNRYGEKKASEIKNNKPQLNWYMREYLKMLKDEE